VSRLTNATRLFGLIVLVSTTEPPHAGAGSCIRPAMIVRDHAVRGPASAYAAIDKTEAAYFRMINEQGFEQLTLRSAGIHDRGANR
jgi:hypothetical protein